MTKENCGCRVCYISNLVGVVDPLEPIIYCSAHAAAFEMRKALKLIRKNYDRGRVAPETQRVVRQVLALAEGKKADHGKPASS